MLQCHRVIGPQAIVVTLGSPLFAVMKKDELSPQLGPHAKVLERLSEAQYAQQCGLDPLRDMQLDVNTV
jgi:hypothetical protein